MAPTYPRPAFPPRGGAARRPIPRGKSAAGYPAATLPPVRVVTISTPHRPDRGRGRRADRGRAGQPAPGGTSRSLWEIVRANVFTRFNAILGALLVVILTVGPYQDALFGVVLVANTGIGIYQEWRAKRTLDRLTLLTAPHVTVVRGGERQDVGVEDVVADDTIELGQGTQIVADGTVPPPTPSRSTSRCCRASRCRWPRGRATRCCRAASSPPGRAGTGRRRSGPRATPTSSPPRPASSRWCGRSCGGHRPDPAPGHVADRAHRHAADLQPVLRRTRVAERRHPRHRRRHRGDDPRGPGAADQPRLPRGVVRLGRRHVLVKSWRPSRASPGSTSSAPTRPAR